MKNASDKTKNMSENSLSKESEELVAAFKARDLAAAADRLKEGADPNAMLSAGDWIADCERPRLLHAALRWNWLEGVEVLLAVGADPQTPSEGLHGGPGQAPLCWAGSAQTARALIEAGADPWAVDARDGRSVAARVAAFIKEPEALPFFTLCRDHGQDLEQRDHEGSSILARAANRLNLDAVAALLSLGCDPNSRNDHGESMLKAVASSLSRDRALRARGKRVAKALIFAGADIDALDHNGEPPEALLRYCAPNLAQEWRDFALKTRLDKEQREIKAQMRRRGARGAGPKRI